MIGIVALISAFIVVLVLIQSIKDFEAEEAAKKVEMEILGREIEEIEMQIVQEPERAYIPSPRSSLERTLSGDTLAPSLNSRAS